MSLFAKLTGSFVLVTLITAMVGIVGWLGINATEKGLNEIASVRMPAMQGLGLMMEAMNGIKSAERTMLMPSISNKDRGHENANLVKRWELFQQGRDLYEPSPQAKAEAEAWNRVPDLISQWQAAHDQLVDKLRGVHLDNVENLATILVQRQLDHVNWVNALEGSLASTTPFSGQLDPAQCAFGKWLAAFTSDEPKFNAIISEMTAPHRKLHSYGQQINELLRQGHQDQALSLFKQEVEPALTAIRQRFDLAAAHVRG